MTEKHPANFVAHKVHLHAVDSRTGQVIDTSADVDLISNGFVINLEGTDERGRKQKIVLITPALQDEILAAAKRGDFNA